ncbi:hypothetical protein sS8_3546 [Methylocaldum marinum]|uniref:Uncharacterized protein n=1 Tax=Methylocaldum marinum TaxID=1432792 RepID=A0A250KUZ1_9GAMM|nr:hypothetical protein sS8_3546 [Methylocaldum marinum]
MLARAIRVPTTGTIIILMAIFKDSVFTPTRTGDLTAMAHAAMGLSGTVVPIIGTGAIAMINRSATTKARDIASISRFVITTGGLFAPGTIPPAGNGGLTVPGSPSMAHGRVVVPGVSCNDDETPRFPSPTLYHRVVFPYLDRNVGNFG